jgi:hypothetical protein
MPKTSAERSAEETAQKSEKVITEEQMDEILARARQTVKPIVNKEAANEIVSDDLLNFRMKAAHGRTKQLE